MLDSDTSASTSRDDMSAMDTTAARALLAEPNGATTSPTSAFLVSTVPSNGARMLVYSSATSPARTAASAARIDAESTATTATARLYRASAASKSARGTSCSATSCL